MEIKLKPCPFCGARSLIGNGPRLTDFNITTSGKTIYEVYCTNCTATINRWFDSEAEAAEAWNRRAERTGHWIKKNGIYECSECGVWFPHRSAYCRDCGAKMDGGKINDT